MKNPLKYLLLPFAWLYGVGVVVRNRLFDWQILKSKSFDLPVIGIGNLSAGGTGKTPMAEYILKLLLENGYKPALLSRGYGRQSSGFMEVLTDSDASLTGDEPFQVKRKFPEAFVAVCEDRVKGIETILSSNPETNVIVLDDSFQHRYVKPGFNILLTDYNRPYYSDLLLPAGMLREPISGRKRADIIIMTKCPEHIDASSKEKIKSKLKPSSSQEVYFTSISYQSLKNINDEDSLQLSNLKDYKIILFTGIANTAPLENFLKEIKTDFQLIKYPDHHYFSADNIEKIISTWKSISSDHKILITTEKDWCRMEGTEQAELFSGLPLYFLPIAVQWNEAEKINFDRTIFKYVERNRAGS